MGAGRWGGGNVMGAGEDGGCTSGRSSGSGVGVVASAAFAFVRLDSLLGACVAVGGVGTVVVGATVLGTSRRKSSACGGRRASRSY